MKIDYNREQVQRTIQETSSISTHSMKDIIDYLEKTKARVYRINQAFGLCEYEYKEMEE